MEILYSITSIAFLIWVIRNIIAWVLLWQENDYSLKRLIFYLRGTSDGRRILFSPLNLLKWGAIVLYISTIFEEQNTLLFHILIMSIYLSEAFFVTKDLLKGEVKKPKFRKEAIFVSILSLLSVAIIFTLPLIDVYFWMLFLDRITMPLVSFFVLAVAFPVEILNDREIEKAVKKIKSCKNLLTIGIVGSADDSATKEFLASLLAKKYNVVSTKGKQKTLAEIAYTITKSLKKTTQIFIFEINDFTKDDISYAAQITKPSIFIITGVSTKPLTGGSSAIAELLNVLPKKTLLLGNADNQSLKKLFEKTKITKKLYSLKDTNNLSSTEKNLISAVDKKIHKNNISFTMQVDNKEIHIVSPLLGRNNIKSLLPAVYIAYFLGLSDTKIKEASLSLRPSKKTMTKKINDDGVILIDNTTNLNPKLILDAVEYLKLYPKKRYVVLDVQTGIGKETERLYKKIASELARYSNTIFLTNPYYEKSIRQSIKESGHKCLVKHHSPEKITSFLSENLKRDDAVLFEGMATKSVLNKLI